MPLQFLRLITAFFKKSRCYFPVLLRRDLIQSRVIDIHLNTGYVPVDLCQRPTGRFVGPALKYESNSNLQTAKPRYIEKVWKKKAYHPPYPTLTSYAILTMSRVSWSRDFQIVNLKINNFRLFLIYTY